MHIHVVPIDNVSELSFAGVDRSPAPEALDDAAETGARPPARARSLRGRRRRVRRVDCASRGPRELRVHPGEDHDVVAKSRVGRRPTSGRRRRRSRRTRRGRPRARSGSTTPAPKNDGREAGRRDDERDPRAAHEEPDPLPARGRDRELSPRCCGRCRRARRSTGRSGGSRAAAPTGARRAAVSLTRRRRARRSWRRSPAGRPAPGRRPAPPPPPHPGHYEAGCARGRHGVWV